VKDYGDGIRPEPGTYRVERLVIGDNGYPTQYHGLDSLETDNSDGMDREHEQTDAEFVRDLAERLRHIPVMYGTDDGDIDRLLEIANAAT
jgi:hypothetical protein